VSLYARLVVALAFFNTPLVNQLKPNTKQESFVPKDLLNQLPSPEKTTKTFISSPFEDNVL
jgi:hypothetical protein